MTLPLKIQDAYVQPPTNAPTDRDTGMQRSTCGGAIGVNASTAGTPAGGAVIGLAAQPDFYVSVANPQPAP